MKTLIDGQIEFYEENVKLVKTLMKRMARTIIKERVN